MKCKCPFGFLYVGYVLYPITKNPVLVARSPTPARSDVFVYSYKTDRGEFTFYLFEFLAFEGTRVTISQ